MPDETQPENTLPMWNAEHLSRARGALDGATPKQIGPFHLLERVGAGGMGEVWKAERRSPIHQLVAVKIIKPGLDTGEVIARFESERQALARMSHPGVARVLDAGTTDTGRPYFVMEYVPGEPITRFADTNKLDIKARLLLFIDVCEAVAHAHQKAIIHRDLKASNVLGFMQNDKPAVKVIDFGVAKALTGDRLTDRTLVTERGQAVGTLDTMSPEQADGSPDIDTRTDVYALGVMLYELLTGAKPFDVKVLARAGNHEILRIIREVEPPRPSTRLSQFEPETAILAATARRIDVDDLARALRSELEWIPLKAMRKERDRRYAGPLELAQDIRRYLDGRPLLAGPETRTYRAQKFLRRNVRGVVALATMLLLLLAGITTTTWQAIRATRALREAEIANANAQAINNFLTTDLLRAADPAVTRGEDLTVKQALDRAAEKVGEKLKDRPEVEASVRGTIAETYDALGRPDLGLPHARATLEIYRREDGDDSARTAGATNSLVQLLQATGQLEEAETLARRAADQARTPGTNLRPMTRITAVSNLAHVLHSLGKFKDAEVAYREALGMCTRQYGPDHTETLTAVSNVASVLQSMGRTDEAVPLQQRNYETRRKILGEDDPTTLLGAGNLAFSMALQNKLAEAEALQRRTLEAARRVLGNEHTETLNVMRNHGDILQDMGRLDEAEALFEESLAISRRLYGDDDLGSIRAVNNVASILRARGRFAESEKLYRDLLERCTRLLPEDHPYPPLTLGSLGAVILLQSRPADAEPFLAESYRRILPLAVADEQKAQIAGGYGLCLYALNRPSEAEPLLTQAAEAMTRPSGAAGLGRRQVLEALVEIATRANRPQDAERWKNQLTTMPTTAAAVDGKQ